jgi:uncharacterized protein (DUF1330 family)
MTPTERPSHVEPTRETLAALGSLPHAAAVGGRVELDAEAQLSVIGPPGEWDDVLLVRYPSHAAFLAMVSEPHYLEAAVHRTAALADSRLVALRA